MISRIVTVRLGLASVLGVLLFFFCTGCAPDSSKSAQKPSSSEKTATIESKLEGVIYSGTNPIAIIGGNNYRLDDTIGSYTIVKIDSDAITLKKENGEAVYRVGDVVTKKIVAVTAAPGGITSGKSAIGSQKGHQGSQGYRGRFDIAFKYYNDAQNYFNTAESHMYYANDKKMRYASLTLESKVRYSSLINRAKGEYTSALEYYQKAVVAAQSSRESERLSDDQNRQMLYIIDKAREKSMLAENEQVECARITEERIPEYKGDGA